MDVIAAIATGSAATAIGIVRVSGDGCFALCGRVFRAAGGRPFAAQAVSYTHLTLPTTSRV